MPRKRDIGITGTDMFCGAGGSSLGAWLAGMTPFLALNHWEIAIKTHNHNFPDCHHDCRDVQATDPRRYPSTNILIASPECTNHSLAKGKKRPHYTKDIFGNVIIDPAEERSRATMYDVPRFVEYHNYDIVIVENVVDVMRWIPLPGWLQTMQLLGYKYQVVCYNSMFAFPTPQSRDRVYFVFWKKGNRAPDLTFMPSAPCAYCGKVVEARQTWKNGKTWGKYGAKQQYIYTCPECRREVVPFYFSAMNAIDWTITAERIGDRKTPLKPKTMERIKYGLEQFGRTPLIVSPRYGEGIASRVHDATTEALPTQPTDASHGIAAPYLFMQNQGERAKGMGEPLPTTTTSRGIVNVVFPYFTGMAYTKANGNYVYDGKGAMPTQTTRGELGMVGVPTSFISTSGRKATPTDAADAMGTLTTIEQHGLVTPFMFPVNVTADKHIDGASEVFGTQTTKLEHGVVAPMMISVNYFNERPRDGATEPQPTQTTGDTWGVAAPSFIAEMHGTSKASSVVDPLMCIATGNHHALLRPDSLEAYMKLTGQPRDLNELHEMLSRMTVEDLTFRMLKAHEIKTGMAFPQWYEILGNSSQQIKQAGNAVTPPVMQMLVERCIWSLEGIQ